MAWKEIAAAAAEHFPRKLFTLLFGVQQERDHSELAYRSLAGDRSGMTAEQFVLLQFVLRRFVIVADEFVNEVNAYYRRPWYRKRLPFLRGRDDYGGVEYFTDVTERRVVRRLRDEHGYDVNDGGSLKAEVDRMDRSRAQRDQWLRRSGQNERAEAGDNK